MSDRHRGPRAEEFLVARFVVIFARQHEAGNAEADRVVETACDESRPQMAPPIRPRLASGQASAPHDEEERQRTHPRPIESARVPRAVGPARPSALGSEGRGSKKRK
jgi:hypothetical protein